MSKKLFTEEQLAVLRQNPYVYSVSPGRLSLTKNFKEIFFSEYRQGISPRMILENHGFDIKVLGDRRVWSISLHIRKEYEKYGEFHEGNPGRKSLNTLARHPVSEKEQIKQLQHELNYLKQEMEFLKKFFSQKLRKVGSLLMNSSSCIFEIIHHTLQAVDNQLSIRLLCSMAGVSRSGYYAWLASE